MSTPLDIARAVVADEARALTLLSQSLGPAWSDAIETIRSHSQVVVSGLGKSGAIAAKIAATLTSTGTPALFMHPVEALHGDLGIVTSQHVLIALSRSGNTEEVSRFVAHFRRLGGPAIGITQGRESRLAELCQHTLLLPDLPEAGPLNLAPTTSCAMMLAAGDALAMALLHARGFAAQDFAQFHPEGTLGRRLLLRAEDLMHTGDDLPLVPAGESFDQLLLEMTRKRLGIALIVEPDGRLLGTFTDGDLRRVLERVRDPRGQDARGAYTRSRRGAGAPPVPISSIEPQRLAVDCLRIMRESQITSLVVAGDGGRPIGLLRLMDLIRAGLA
ncbi:MAG: KpsF/GutQ family sugar-phosphate isomerase [Phycisphaerae bacterium]